MKRVYAAEIRPGDAVNDWFLVAEARLAPYRDGHKGQYLQVILADRSGRVEARLWDDAEKTACWLAPGDIVRVEARAKLYRERLRLRLDRLEPAGNHSPPLEELLVWPAIDVSEGLAAVQRAIAQVIEPNLRALLESFFGDPDFVSAFSLAPLTWPGRLLARTVELLELASPLPRLAPNLDRDLLLAALLLHGIGETQSLAGPDGIRAGKLLGVPALSDQLLVERLVQAPDFPPGLAVDLRHAVLAARDPGQAQSGEAAVLAQLRRLQEALANCSPENAAGQETISRPDVA